QISNLKATIKEKREYLIFNERILNVCDAIVRPATIDIAKMSTLTMKQKQHLLLEKLFMVYDNYYYPVAYILRGNGVNLKRFNESDELAEKLADAGLVQLQGYLGGQRTAQLTTDGVSYIEEYFAPVKENYNDISNTYAEMSAKLDEIKEELIKSNLGNEILFDEFQELKEMYKILNKKNWGQLLKGKLIDVLIGKLVDASTITFIYESLTQHKLNLP